VSILLPDLFLDDSRTYVSGRDTTRVCGELRDGNCRIASLWPVDSFSELDSCFESDTLQAVYDDYIARGVTPNFKIRKAGAGNLLFTLKGPLQATGPQNIEYTQYMPGSRHYSDRGQHLGADRVGTKLISVTLAMQDPAAAQDFYLKQLQFTPDARHPMTFNLPGTSSEQVEIVPLASLGSKGRITLATSSLKRSSTLLKQAHVEVKKSKKALTVTDPDGNFIVIEAR
jgi:hypothetical protein